jgi:hypothetical protein
MLSATAWTSGQASEQNRKAGADQKMITPRPSHRHRRQSTIPEILSQRATTGPDKYMQAVPAE